MAPTSMQVLLAEHHKHARRLLRHLLNQRHIDVVEADTGADCVDALRSGVTLALVDWRLPPGHGDELFREIRRKLSPERLYLVGVVQASDDAMLDDAVHAGADDTLALPASLEVVQRRLDVFLRIASRLNGQPVGTQSGAASSEADRVLDLVEAPAVAIDPARTMRHVNAAFSELVGIEAELLVGLPANALGLTESAVTAGAATILRPDGSSVTVELTALPIAIKSQHLAVYICEPFGPDTHAAPNAPEGRTSAPRDLYLMFERGGAVRSISDVLAETLGFAPSEVLGRDIRDLLHPDDVPMLRDTLPREGRDATGAVLRVQQRDGSWRPLRFSGRSMPKASELEGFVLIGRSADAAPGEQARESVESTGLPPVIEDRAQFLEKLDDALAVTSGSHGCSVLSIRVERVGFVDERPTRETGERMLLAIAERLREHVRQEDVLSRVNNEQFAILARSVRDSSAAVAIAERILDDFRRKAFRLGERDVYATLSIGISHGAAPAATADRLLHDAEDAMACVDDTSRGGYQVYSDDAVQHPPDRLVMRADILRAVERNELRVHYQPEVDLRDGHILGVEALVRWQHAERGLLLPAEFIDAAEESGTLDLIGEWVLERATRDAAEWQRQFELGDEFTVAVNFSATQLRQEDLVERVARALRRANLSALNLRIEITEDLLIGQDSELVVMLDHLKELGLELAIDDVGHGDSALDYLQWLPARTIKIEQSLMVDAASGSGRLSTAHAVVAIARSMGVTIIVKGIDSAAQLERVIALGVPGGQGFYFSRPVSRETLAFLLSAGPQPFHALLRGAERA
jgi:diguanylate cyclase (GGDEF)-like protein/PAS domain S-box-containing protein